MHIKICVVFACFFALVNSIFGLDTLDVLGHIPGAASAAVEYSGGRLYAGAGSSMFIYESEDPADMTLLGWVDFSSLITGIVAREDSMIFVGANHDGLYAVDASNPDFPIVAQFKMPTRDHWVADIELTSPDTVWLSDNRSLKKLHFTGDTFLVVEEYFSGQTISGADFRDTLAVVTRRGILQGFVELYNRADGGFTHVATFDSSRLWYVCDAQFADNRDDIIYVLGGSPNLGVDGDFYALHYDGDSLYRAAGHKFNGVPGGLAQTFIMSMDSRNDTVYLATMAAVAWGETPLGTTCPAIDGNFLPDSMPIIANFIPGLWFFDVALHDELPALAIGSEWLGVLWTDISDFSVRDDTIRTYPTGGWGQHSYLYGGDTLFVAMEGYGVGIFDVRDKSTPQFAGRIPGSFCHDIGFLDSIAIVCKSAKFEFHNLAPWWRGGEIERIDTFAVPLVFGEVHSCLSVSIMRTPTDTLLILPIYDDGINIIDPRDIPGAYARAHFFDNTSPIKVFCENDTMFILTADTFYVVRYLGDTLEHIFQMPTGGDATGFCKEGAFTSITQRNNGIRWFDWAGDTLIERGSWDPWGFCIDSEFFDSLLYVVCAGEGLFILDIEDYPEIDTLANYPGSQGWEFLQYGSQHVHFGPDSTIYLADYHAGAYILEPFHRGSVGLKEISPKMLGKISISSYPNPFNSSVTISLDVVGAGLAPARVEIYDVNGRLLHVISREGFQPDEKSPTYPQEISRQARNDTKSEFIWRPDESIPSGVYLIRARFDSWSLSGAETIVATKRIVYLK